MKHSCTRVDTIHGVLHEMPATKNKNMGVRSKRMWYTTFEDVFVAWTGFLQRLSLNIIMLHIIAMPLRFFFLFLFTLFPISYQEPAFHLVSTKTATSGQVGIFSSGACVSQKTRKAISKTAICFF